VTTLSLNFLAKALWLFAESQYNQTVTIATQLGEIMAAVQVEQDDLDTLATDFEAVKTTLSDEITALENNTNIPAGSLDGLRQALADLQNISVPASNSASST
jgi:hypothetical protein